MPPIRNRWKWDLRMLLQILQSHAGWSKCRAFRARNRDWSHMDALNKKNKRLIDKSRSPKNIRWNEANAEDLGKLRSSDPKIYRFVPKQDDRTKCRRFRAGQWEINQKYVVLDKIERNEADLNWKPHRRPERPQLSSNQTKQKHTIKRTTLRNRTRN